LVSRQVRCSVWSLQTVETDDFDRGQGAIARERHFVDRLWWRDQAAEVGRRRASRYLWLFYREGMIDRIDVLEVPFNSSGLDDGVAHMPEVLAGAGLYEALRRHVEVGHRRVPFESPEPVRGPSGLLAEGALVSMVESLSATVAQIVGSGSWPLVVGGDCSVLVGALLGTRLAGLGVGLLFVDGHEDAWPPHVSTTGETSDCELGIAFGWHPAPEPLNAYGPFISSEHVVVLGPRDQTELADASVASIGDRVQMIGGDQLAHSDVSSVGANSAARLRRRTARWWLHIDLDVLTTEALHAVDYPQPGGLSWSQLHDLTTAALREGGCVGASVVIYNPDLDNGANAERIVSYIEQLTTTDQPA